MNQEARPDNPAEEKAQNWSFDFTPDKGPGSYTVLFWPYLGIREKETGSRTNIGNMLMIPVSVLPNFKITSPTAGFIYPQGAVVDVRTSLDGNSTQWKEIQWTLNQKPWLPGTLEPPHKLALTEVGTYTLKAEYVVGPDQTWSHSVSFTVKPVKVSILPERKVLPFSQGLVFPLQGKLDFDGKILEDSEKHLDLGNGVTARVTKVEWQAVTNPTGSGELKTDKNLLAPNVVFKQECAVTALATVSISISKVAKFQNGSSSKTQIVEEYFVLPAVRADLWVIAPLVWTQLSGTFPNQAIAKAGRTFSLKDGDFSFQGTPCLWSPPSGLKDPITLTPAVPNPGVQSPTTKEVRFVWSGPDSQTSEQTPFPPIFKDVGNFDVLLDSFLSFGSDGEIPFNQKKAGVKVVSLESLIDYYIDPQSFEMTIGDTLNFKFVVKAKESPQPVPTVKPKEGEVFLLDGAYKLSLENVDWVSILNGQSSSVVSGLDFPFSPKDIGLVSILATAPCRLEELFVPAKLTETWWHLDLHNLVIGSVEKPKIIFYANEKPLGLGSETYYLGQKIELSFKAFNHSMEKEIIVKDPIWHIASPVIAFFNITPETQMAGTAMEVQGFAQKKLPFFIYDYDPKKTSKAIDLMFSISNSVHSSSTSLNYFRPILSSLSCPINSPGIVNRNGAVAIGFQPNPPGFAIDLELSNPSDTAFEVNSVQLINHDCERKLSSGTYQYLQTNPSEMPSPPFWLDTIFPYNSISHPLAPGGPKTIRALRDSPWFGLESPFFEVTELSASSSFLTYVIVRPISDQIADSIWCPIDCFSWSWGGKARKVDGTWSGVDNSFFIKQLNLPNSFPNWEDKFIPPTATATGVPSWQDGKMSMGVIYAY
jgi:hypothetical protein